MVYFLAVLVFLCSMHSPPPIEHTCWMVAELRERSLLPLEVDRDIELQIKPKEGVSLKTGSQPFYTQKKIKNREGAFC